MPQVMMFKRTKYKSDEDAFKAASSFLQIVLNSGSIAIIYINMDGDVVVEYNELNITENAAPFWLTPDEVNFVGPYKMENRLYQLEEEADQLRAQLDALDSEKDKRGGFDA